MFAQLMVFGFIFVTCDAQEHLTCLRTDELLTPSPPTTDVRTQQGRPGRRGAMGPVGPIGFKGLKGDPGIPDNSLLNSLKANFTLALLRGYMDLDDGWVSPFNGYQYKATPRGQSWSAGRTVCQQWGSDLAQYGVRDVATRISLYRGLSLRNWYWIGLSDSASEGSWLWLNGNRANPDDVSLWGPGYPYPTNSANRDCAYVYFYDNSSGLLVFDGPCGASYPALCEKEVDD